VDWLRVTVVTAGIMLFQKGGDVGTLIQEVGGMLYAPYMDDDRIRAYFGRRRKVESADVLETIF